MTTILSMRPVHLADVSEIAGELEEKPDFKEYLKQFSKLTKKEADGLADKLRSLNNAKIREEYLVKLVDLLPKDAESVTKIFNDTSLDEKEINDILAVVKEH